MPADRSAAYPSICSAHPERVEGCPLCYPEPTAAMTHDQRHQLRHLIDQAKRQQLDAHKPPPGRNQAARRATYRAYYRRNRKRILAAKTARKAAGG